MSNWLSELAEAASNGVPNDGPACVCNGAHESVTTTLTMSIEEGGEPFEVVVPAIKCLECGIVWPKQESAEKLCHAEACRQMGILPPEEVADLRRELGMTRKVFGEAFGIPHASMERWENGKLHQNKSMDTLLRALMIPGLAEKLDRRKIAKPTKNSGDNIIAFPLLSRKPKEEISEILERQARFQLRM